MLNYFVNIFDGRPRIQEISVTVPQRILKEIDELVKKYKFGSRSHAIVVGLIKILEEEKKKEAKD